MNTDQKIYHTGFGHQAFSIECDNDEAYALAAFLFLDFPGASAGAPTLTYRILSSGAMFTLWDGEKQRYSGTSRYQLAYVLMNEVLFHCITSNDWQHALHAGAVTQGNRCIILPGQSGNGKSTLTCWLLLQGFHYLTDELVFLSSDATIAPITRPLSLKVGPSHESWLLESRSKEIISDDSGSMIPHRLFNPDFFPGNPRVTDIFFPQYTPDAQSELIEISPAKSSLYLLKSYVNARNFKDHGIEEITAIVRQCRSYTLTYSSFDDLRSLFTAQLGLL